MLNIFTNNFFTGLIIPGPGEYNVTSGLGRSHNRKAPAFSIGRRLKEKLGMESKKQERQVGMMI